MRNGRGGVLAALLSVLAGCEVSSDRAAGSSAQQQALSTVPQSLRVHGLASGEGAQSKTTIATGDGEWLVLWQDARAERSRLRDLYAARVWFDGGLRDPLGIPLSAAPTDMIDFTRGAAVALWTGSAWDVAWVETEEGGPVSEGRLLRATLWPDGGVAQRTVVQGAQFQIRLQDLHLVPTGGVPALTYTSELEVMGSFERRAPHRLGLLAPGGHHAVWDGQRVLVTFADGLGGLHGASVDADGGLIVGADGGFRWTVQATGVTAGHVSVASPDAGVLVAYPRQVGTTSTPISINGVLVLGPSLVASPPTGSVLATTTSTNLAAIEVDLAWAESRWLVSWQSSTEAFARDLAPSGASAPFRIAAAVTNVSGPHHIATAPGQLAVVASHYVGADPYWATLERYSLATRVGSGQRRLSHTVAEAAPGVACGATTCMAGYTEQQERFVAPIRVALVDFDGGLQASIAVQSSAKSERPLIAAIDGGFVVSAAYTSASSLGSTRVFVSTALTEWGGNSSNAYATNDVASSGDSAIRFGRLATMLQRELLPSGAGATAMIPSFGPVAVGTRQRDALGVFHALDGGAIVSVLMRADGGLGVTAVLSDPMGLHGLRKPAVASDGVRYLVTWEEPADGGRAIIGRFVAADGGAGPGPFPVSSRAGWHRAPAATFVNGRYLVGWEYAEEQFAQADLQYVLLDREGRPQADPFGGIVADSPAFEHGLTVAPLGTDGVLATWVRVDEPPLPGAEAYLSFIPVQPEPPDAGAGGGAAGGSAGGAGGGSAGGASGGSAGGGSAGGASGGGTSGGQAGGGSAGGASGGSAGGGFAGGASGGFAGGSSGGFAGGASGGGSGGGASGGFAGGASGGFAGGASGGSAGGASGGSSGSAGGASNEPSTSGCGCSGPVAGESAWLFGALALALRRRRVSVPVRPTE